MHPRRYEIGSDGRIVLVELTSDETLEFEVFEQSIADNGDGDEVKAQPAMEPLLHWLELYHRHYQAANNVQPAADSAFANDASSTRLMMKFDQPTRVRFQRAHTARPPETKFVAMLLAGILVLFVAGVTLII
jgi:hypothetical protein